MSLLGDRADRLAAQPRDLLDDGHEIRGFVEDRVDPVRDLVGCVRLDEEVVGMNLCHAPVKTSRLWRADPSTDREMQPEGLIGSGDLKATVEPVDDPTGDAGLVTEEVQHHSVGLYDVEDHGQVSLDGQGQVSQQADSLDLEMRLVTATPVEPGLPDGGRWVGAIEGPAKGLRGLIDDGEAGGPPRMKTKGHGQVGVGLREGSLTFPFAGLCSRHDHALDPNGACPGQHILNLRESVI